MKFNKMFIGLLLTLLVAATQVQAIEITPPTTMLGNVGSGSGYGIPAGGKSLTFFADGVTSFAITNSGTGTIVTNDYGITNLISYNRVIPGSGFVSTATYVTNALVNPYFWIKDGRAAIHRQITGVQSWVDVPVWADGLGNSTSNTAISLAVCGEATTTTNIGTAYFAKSGDGQYFDTNSASLYSFTFGPIVGTNVWATNAVPPATFLNGCRFIRCVGITGGTNSPAATNYIVGFSLNGNGRQ